MEKNKYSLMIDHNSSGKKNQRTHHMDRKITNLWGQGRIDKAVDA